MNENQESIYNGLKSIGEEISGFYLSGLKIINDDALPSKTYFIAHSAREIDGGIRDILAPKEEKEKKQKELSLEGELKNTKGHIASILVALDLPIDDPFALEYIDVATKFVKHTHRSGAFKPPRESSDIILLWEKYEMILLKLLGNFINQLKQIERILKFDKPTDEILHTIKNIFNDKQKEHYFYSHLKNINWLEPLHQSGFFSPEYLLDDFYWNQSEYLEYLSVQIKEGKIDEDYSVILVKIIEDVCYYSTNIKKVDNYRIWYTFLTIMANLPKDFISDEIIDYLPIFIKTKFENILQSDAIFKLINSYFEKEEDSINHKLKIEKIINLVFEISDNEIFKDRSTYETAKFHPIIRSYRLKQACSNESFYIPVANYCSNEVIYQIAQNLLRYLESEYISSFQIQSLFNNDEEDRNSYSVQTIYTTFLKNCCVKIACYSSIRINEIIEAFLSSDFGHKYFTKLALFLISKTWKQSKHFFFELIENQDRKMLFSNSYWGDDLYFFLEDIALELTKSEASIANTLLVDQIKDREGVTFHDLYERYPDFHIDVEYEKELLKAYLFEGNRRIAYITGASLYNQMGLTRQVASKIKIASRGKRIYVQAGNIKASPVKSYVEVTNDNFQQLRFLDALKDINKISDLDPESAVVILSNMIKEMPNNILAQTIKYALVYPPRTSALLGALLDKVQKTEFIQTLKESLNPFSEYKTVISKQLPESKNWNLI